MRTLLISAPSYRSVVSCLTFFMPARMTQLCRVASVLMLWQSTDLCMRANSTVDSTANTCSHVMSATLCLLV